MGAGAVSRVCSMQTYPGHGTATSMIKLHAESLTNLKPRLKTQEVAAIRDIIFGLFVDKDKDTCIPEQLRGPCLIALAPALAHWTTSLTNAVNALRPTTVVKRPCILC